ncbi:MULTISPECIES: SDR family NAD(P)-dependent oxidoreductase [Streptomycetaceae]|uniref:Putative oxidoreductase n=1 Tax=Streptantibioticus cattleyicolor (strain ATCC 35852 / DSM 46488 / JCM 4925 / NBRC 14057 / NRRL 8057) TaxID=1003195 RepID=F8JXY7_STREN|nr:MULTISPECIES: SDR family NAD(P)-dependent oxidoreductase [Streptomycetaceae]AEW93368.1 putative oxidoreductase [Streptantibioticus cattleyicolor NRRL 8057 = DSM 46488]MYS58084.1 SDR family NAD(P)-dependent oxidoreductase [Streptomyces sp. SID5468]CCB73724.1 putative oxidoreductase [Streptantibioticus cattleyicolor NRRL 8057 = DSM 46488]
MPVAIVTGASRGLGLALAAGLAARGWEVVADARSGPALRSAVARLPGPGRVRAVPGDVTDAGHRSRLVAAAMAAGGVDLLVNNASVLGAEPLVPLADHPLTGLRAALETNAVAPLALVQEALPHLRAAGGAVLSVTSDAAVEAYPTWGGYGASKAALERLCAVLAVEEPAVRVWWVDPGDMRTAMYEAAVPGDPDAAARPDPAGVVPALLRLVAERPASGRYLAGALLEAAR